VRDDDDSRVSFRLVCCPVVVIQVVAVAERCNDESLLAIFQSNPLKNVGKKEGRMRKK
jgi:hypothetical protein